MKSPAPTSEGLQLQLEAAVAEFRKYLSDKAPQFQVVLLDDKNWTDNERRKYRRGNRFHERSGAYLHYSIDGTLLYVGRAFSKNQRLERAKASYCEDRRWTMAVLVKRGVAFFIPSLELFLIWQLRPLYNKADKGDIVTPAVELVRSQYWDKACAEPDVVILASVLMEYLDKEQAAWADKCWNERVERAFRKKASEVTTLDEALALMDRLHEDLI